MKRDDKTGGSAPTCWLPALHLRLASWALWTCCTASGTGMCRCARPHRDAHSRVCSPPLSPPGPTLFGEAVWKSGFLSIRNGNSGRELAYFLNAEASSLSTFRDKLPAQASPVDVLPLGACDVKCGAPYMVTSLADQHTRVSQSARSRIRTYLKCANLNR